MVMERDATGMRRVEKKTDQVRQSGQLGSQRYELLSQHGGPRDSSSSALVRVRPQASSKKGKYP